MAQHKVESILLVQPESPQIRLPGKDVAQINVLALQCTFLPGLHGGAEEHPCAAGAVCGSLHVLCGAELASPVSEQDMYILAEELGSEDLFQVADAGEHGRGCLFPVQEGKEQAGLHKLEGLDERAM